MKHTSFVVVAALLAFAQTAAAQGASARVDTVSAVRIDLPIIDAPYNVAHGLRAPSMSQSAAVAEGFYEIAHPAIQRAWGTHTKLANLSITLFDIFGSTLPGADAWMHEEFHRAVLGNQGVGSFDDIYK